MVYGITTILTGANLNQRSHIERGPHIVGKQDFAKKMIDRKWKKVDG